MGISRKLLKKILKDRGVKQLYRETSPQAADELIDPLTFADSPGDLFFADNADMALGQGDNRGVVIRFDPGQVEGAAHTTKPLDSLLGSEYTGRFTGRPQDAVEGFVIGGDLPNTPYVRRMQHLADDLKAKGWTEVSTERGKGVLKPGIDKFGLVGGGLLGAAAMSPDDAMATDVGETVSLLGVPGSKLVQAGEWLDKHDDPVQTLLGTSNPVTQGASWIVDDYMAGLSNYLKQTGRGEKKTLMDRILFSNPAMIGF